MKERVKECHEYEKIRREHNQENKSHLKIQFREK